MSDRRVEETADPRHAAVAPRLHLDLFSGMKARVGGRDLEVSIKRGQALIAILVLEPGMRLGRDRLAGLLWSEMPEENAKHSLRNAISKLRRVLHDLGPDALVADRREVRLETTSVSCDVLDVLSALAAGETPALLLERPRVADTLLAGFEDVDPQFFEWLSSARQLLAQQICQRLQARIRGADERRDPAIERAARALRLQDPALEEPVRALMLQRAAAGDAGEALRIYKSLEDHLAEEFDTEPSQQTKDLAVTIRDMHAGACEGPSVVVSTDFSIVRVLDTRLVLGVGPFDTTDLNPRDRQLVKMFRHDLITELARFREWIIRDQAADEPGDAAPGWKRSDYAVQATAFRAQRAVHLQLTLQAVPTCACLWGDRVTLRLDRQAAQDQIVNALTRRLSFNVKIKHLDAIDNRPESELQSYDLWLRGQALFMKFDPKFWDKAERLFKLAIKKTPGYAPAYSSLAQIYNTHHLVMPGVFRDRKRAEIALGHARQAAHLDPLDSRSHLCLAWSFANNGQHEHAVKAALRAYELNCNDIWTQVSVAGCLAISGEHGRGQQIADRVLKVALAPSTLQWAYHVSIRFMGGDYAAVVEAAEAAGAFSYVPGLQAAALAHLGRQDEGRKVLERWKKQARGRWAGVHVPRDEDLFRWLMSAIPMKRAEDWRRLQDGLAVLGAPVQRLTHDAW